MLPSKERRKKKKLFHVQPAEQSDVCIPRGTVASFDPTESFSFQILHWEAFDEGGVPQPEAPSHQGGKPQHYLWDHLLQPVLSKGNHFKKDGI